MWNSTVPLSFSSFLNLPSSTRFESLHHLGEAQDGLEGVQSRPPFYFSFFSNFSNLRHRFGTNMNLSTFIFHFSSI